MGWAHLLGIIGLSIVVGVIMQTVFWEKTGESPAGPVAIPEIEIKKRWWVLVIFFGLLIAIMIFALSKNWVYTGGLVVVLIAVCLLFFTRDDFITWMRATYQFVRSILPWLVIGSAGAAVVAGLVPSGLVSSLAGGNSLGSSIISGTLGTLMYICPPSEVLFTRAFVDLGMGQGPALAFLLTGPAVSFPSIIILNRLIGWKRSLSFVFLLLILAVITGYIFGLIVS